MKQKRALPYLMILPTYVLFILFFLIPLGYSFTLSLVEWNGFSVERTFVGLSHYARLFGDANFLNALKNTLTYIIIAVPLSVSISLVLSYILNKSIVGFQVLKAIFFLPHIVSLVAVGVVWSWIFLPDKYGLVNSILVALGFGVKGWFADVNLAMASLIIIGVWKSVGYNMVIFIAGLMGIPSSLYEAADIDGATSVQKFFRITVPMLRPTVFFVMVSSTTYALFQIFDVVKVTTDGGPIGKTEMLVTYLYKVGFEQYKMGYASAIAFVLFFITVAIVVMQRKFVEER